MENKSIGNVALLGIFVTIVSAIGAVGSALYTRHISEATKEPVSYTHLRAHETVLDLVCRLLLEKKKKHE